MRLNKNMISVFAIGVCLTVWGMMSKGYAQVPTPTMTDSEYDSYMESVSEGRWEEEKARNAEGKNKIKPTYHPWHSHYTPVPQPDSPTHFKAVPGDGMVYLSWDPMPRAIGYVVFVSDDGKNFQRRFRKPLSKTEITIGVLQNGKTYYFAVDSVGQAGHETNKAVQSVVPLKIKTQSYLFGREVCV